MMKEIYIVEVKEKGRWREIARHKCNKLELKELKKNIFLAFGKEDKPLTTGKIRKVTISGDGEK